MPNTFNEFFLLSFQSFASDIFWKSSPSIQQVEAIQVSSTNLDTVTLVLLFKDIFAVCLNKTISHGVNL